MFRVNVQNVLYRLQRRLSVACAIHWSSCQSLTGPDSPIPPRHCGAAVPRPWSGGGCTHTCRIPTPRSRRGSDPTVRRPCRLSYQVCEPCPADRYGATRITFDAAGINLTQYSFNSTQRPVFIQKHSQYFCCSVELCCLNTFIVCLPSLEKGILCTV